MMMLIFEITSSTCMRVANLKMYEHIDVFESPTLPTGRHDQLLQELFHSLLHFMTVE